MKNIIILLSILNVSICFSQIKSGVYDDGLHLAYNPKTNNYTGFYESYTGYDEETKESKFSCIFYIEGKSKSNQVEITTYYPLDKKDDIINGKFQIIKPNQIQIRLEEEHGGCWNVTHFNDEPVNFEIQKEEKWIEIRYINTPKAYFYSNKKESTKKKAYLIKGDVIYIDAVVGNWAHCLYYGKKTSEGWMKLNQLNTLN